MFFHLDSDYSSTILSSPTSLPQSRHLHPSPTYRKASPTDNPRDSRLHLVPLDLHTLDHGCVGRCAWQSQPASACAGVPLTAALSTALGTSAFGGGGGGPVGLRPESMLDHSSRSLAFFHRFCLPLSLGTGPPAQHHVNKDSYPPSDILWVQSCHSLQRHSTLMSSCR